MPRRRSRSPLAWGSDPAGAIELLREAEVAARELDDPDALFRIRANLTTVLDLVGRRTEAVEVAYDGIEDARRAGLEAVYGNFLAGNVADSLFLLGRWPEAERLCSERAMSWLPVGVVYLAGVLQLAIVEIETDAGEARHPPARPDDPRVRRRARAAAGRSVLPGGRLVRAVARRHRRREPIGRSRLGDASARHEEWVLVARMAAMVAQVDAATATEAREQRQLAPLAAARQRTTEVLATAAALVRRLRRPGDGRLAPRGRGLAGDGAGVPAPARG